MIDAPPAFHDPLAEALWHARLVASTVEPGVGVAASLERARAEAVAAELYGALAREGARQAGWKLAATDRRTQVLLGADGPFVAPVYRATVLEIGSHISLSRFVAPRLEAEIGVEIQHESFAPVPCLEIADTRFARWPASLSEAIADFGLQGAIVFGQPVSGVSTVDIVIYHGGLELARGSRSVEAAIKLSALVGSEPLDVSHDEKLLVATGAITAPLPLAVGSWRVDFGALGTLELEVDP